MPILTRAIREGKTYPPYWLKHIVACRSCMADGPAVFSSSADSQRGAAEAIHEAKRAGFREVRDVDGGNFKEYVCARCAGELML